MGEEERSIDESDKGEPCIEKEDFESNEKDIEIIAPEEADSEQENVKSGHACSGKDSYPDPKTIQTDMITSPTKLSEIKDNKEMEKPSKEEEDSEADFGKNEIVNEQTNETALVMTEETSPQSEKAEELNKKTIVDPVPPICDTVSPLTMEEAEKPRNGDIIRSHDCEIFAEAVSDRKSSMTRKDSIKAESP